VLSTLGLKLEEALHTTEEEASVDDVANAVASEKAEGTAKGSKNTGKGAEERDARNNGADSKATSSGDIVLMAVAIGASCAFLTPIGHQNNTLILGPGGFRFGDYWKLGLPLELLVIAVSLPMLLLVWPL